MTTEEYRENLIRMWDSVRTEHKGEKDCVGVGCSYCPLNNEVSICNIYKSIEIVENWAKEHPIVTNADKFKEVFGLDMAPIHSCVNFKEKCGDCEYTYDGKCAVSKLFWNAEYKEPAESEVE